MACSGKCGERQVERSIWCPKLHAPAESRRRRARVSTANCPQISGGGTAISKCFHLMPNEIRRAASDFVMTNDSNQRSGLSPHKIVGSRHIGLQKEKTPRFPVQPVLEGLTSETDVLAEFMSRPASSL